MQSTKEEYHFARAFSPQKQDEAEEALLQHQKRLLNATLGVSMRNTVGYDLILCLLGAIRKLRRQARGDG